MKNVMFVDDESRILDGIRRMLYLERKRWNMEFCLGGESALKTLESKPFDIIVSDMRMPGMDGSALLTKVREISPSTVRIILSGHTELEAAMRAIPVAHRFLAKPCNAAVLRDTIERTCELQDVLSSPDIRRIVSGLSELPSPRTSLDDLTQALADPAVTIERLTQIIGRDIAMSAKVLQFANSAFFGASQTVTTVAGSVGYLGVETLRNLTLNVKAFRAVEPHPAVPAIFWEELARHASRAAAIVATLPLDKESRDIAISAAFLHELGDLVVAGYMPETLVSVLSTSRERKCKTFEIEEQMLGFSHAEIGAYLLGIWGVPHSIVDAIANHHHPDRNAHTGLDPSAAVYVADLLSQDSAHLLPHDQACLQSMGLTAQFEEWRKDLKNRPLAAGA